MKLLQLLNHSDQIPANRVSELGLTPRETYRSDSGDLVFIGEWGDLEPKVTTIYDEGLVIKPSARIAFCVMSESASFNDTSVLEELVDYAEVLALTGQVQNIGTKWRAVGSITSAEGAACWTLHCAVKTAKDRLVLGAPTAFHEGPQDLNARESWFNKRRGKP